MGDEDNKSKLKVKDKMFDQLRSNAAFGGRPQLLEIGKLLRDYYDQVARQPVPERFTDLLNKLDSRTTPKKDS